VSGLCTGAAVPLGVFVWLAIWLTLVTFGVVKNTMRMMAMGDSVSPSRLEQYCTDACDLEVLGCIEGSQ
jgi:hypothetical protein